MVLDPEAYRVLPTAKPQKPPPVPGERWEPADDLVDLVDTIVDRGDLTLITRALEVIRDLLARYP